VANKNKLTQVFINLIQNALDALKNKPVGPEPPIIRITGRREGERVMIAIRDNGEGVEPQNLARIFDPFFTTRDVGKGMGMGLSICYRIVQEYQGRLSVASERGKYCEFTVELPADLPEPVNA
jgi:C4-dicarboxylate-specific signal transduction histidine kinase